MNIQDKGRTTALYKRFGQDLFSSPNRKLISASDSEILEFIESTRINEQKNNSLTKEELLDRLNSLVSYQDTFGETVNIRGFEIIPHEWTKSSNGGKDHWVIRYTRNILVIKTQYEHVAHVIGTSGRGVKGIADLLDADEETICRLLGLGVDIVTFRHNI
jgi:CII-binding regulator of phage lambda lysogenization HflD